MRHAAASCRSVGTTIFTVMSRRARELGAINLGQGFPDYDIDPRFSELVHEAMRQGHNQYAPMPGCHSCARRSPSSCSASYGAQVDPGARNHRHARRHRGDFFGRAGTGRPGR